MGHIAGLLLTSCIGESNSAAWWGCTTAQPDPTNRSDFCVEPPGVDPGPMDFQSIAMTASARAP